MVKTFANFQIFLKKKQFKIVEKQKLREFVYSFIKVFDHFLSRVSTLDLGDLLRVPVVKHRGFCMQLSIEKQDWDSRLDCW